MLSSRIRRALTLVAAGSVAAGLVMLAPPAHADAGFSLSGHVYLGSTSRPAGAVVRVSYSTTPNVGFQSYVDTDATGAYSIAGLAAGTYYLKFDYRGQDHYSGRWWANGTDISAAKPLPVSGDSPGRDIVLPLQAAVSGTVSFGVVGNHAGAATVTAQSASDSSSSVTARPDADGHFILWLDPSTYYVRFFPEQGGYQFQSWHDSDAYNGDALQVGTTDIAGIDQTLPATGSITGHVYMGSPSRSAAAGEVQVSLSPSMTTLTDAHGDYTFAGLADGAYALTFDDVVDTTFTRLTGVATTVTRSALTVVAPDATMLSSGSIVGHINLGDSNHPAGQGEVEVYFDGPDSAGILRSPRASTDASGNFTITGLTPSAYHLYFHYTGSGAFADEYWQESFGYPTSIATPVGNGPITRNVTLVASGSVTGKLIRADAHPVYAFLYAHRVGPSGDDTGLVQVSSNPDGTFAFPRLPPGSYTIDIEDRAISGLFNQWYHQSSGKPHGEMIVVTAGSASDLGNLPLLAGSAITVPVTCLGTCGPAGQLNATGSLEGRDSPSSPWVYVRGVWTDVGGFSVAGLGPGQYRATFNGPHDYACTSATSDPLNLVDGQTLIAPLTIRCGSGGVPPGPPSGAFESAQGLPGGSIAVSGWAVDPDSIAAISVYPYTDGIFTNGVTADANRPDIGAKYPGYGDGHGFSTVIAGTWAPGKHTVCLVAQNYGPGTNTSLGCRAVYVPSPADISYVRALYHDYLNREPSTLEISFWTTAIGNGAPRTSIADGFVNSDEYRLIRIDQAYRTILGREPESQGRLWWLAALKSGALHTDDVARQFYSSGEYVARAQHWSADGSETRQWIHQLYTDLLHRDPDAGGLDFWEAAAKAKGRQAVVDSLWTSQETAGARVSAMYSSYLGRTPDASGLAFWTRVDLTLGDSVTRSSITGSSEYYNLASTRYPATTG